MTLATPRESSAERFVLYDVDWAFYEQLLARLSDRRVFVTYDRGSLELMSPSYRHDRTARLVGLVLGMLTEELDLPLIGGGSTTFRREDLKRGLEPDACFYLANAARVEGLQEIDLQRDPPPDLVVEIEISRRLGGRREIYAAMGVPEIWVHDGTGLEVLVLAADDDRYERAERSPTFPSLPLDQVEQWIARAAGMDETRWVKGVRRWIREHLPKP